MYVVREIMYCKPGKVRAMVDKFKAMNALSGRVGMPTMRILTDFAADRYWTVVAEMEVTDLAAYERMMASPAGTPEDNEKLAEIMKGYHDLLESGCRQIYKVEE